jgi:hypothetical protein
MPSIRPTSPPIATTKDGTVTDLNTGLMWSKKDRSRGMNGQDGLGWVQARNKEHSLGHNDWRLPNAKELQSILDYTRAPQAADTTRRGPAIDPIFDVSRLEDGEYPFFWTSTTHLDGPRDRQGTAAIYIAFGRALGWMQFPPGRGEYRLLDFHGAGAQRSDPKIGDPGASPHGRGPHGDVVRISNHVRYVRGPIPRTKLWRSENNASAAAGLSQPTWPPESRLNTGNQPPWFSEPTLVLLACRYFGGSVRPM